MRLHRYSKPEAFPDLATKHWVIEASAGTGKTFTIESLVVDLVLEADLPLEKIVIVTYTEAASLELRRRIREKLQELLDLAKDELTAVPSHWVLDDGARGKLALALQSFDRTVISTIHAFCQKILQDGAFESGRLFRQQRADEKELFAEAFRDHLRTTYSATEADRRFLVEALDWFGSPDQLRTVLEGAWGARATLVPAADDLDRARRAVQDFPLDQLAEETSLVAAYGKGSYKTARTRFLALGETLTSLRSEESLHGWIRLVGNDLFEDLSGAVWGKAVWEDPLPPGPAQRIRAGLQALKDTLPTIQGLVVHRLLPPLVAALEVRKAQEGLYDFNDMIDQVAEGLADPALVARQKDRYAAALIDEFQDTDARQWEIFQAIFGDADHRLILVGDPKQAIYDFRGGDLPTYLKARDQLRRSGGKSLPLEKNHRSSAALVQAVNQVLVHEGSLFTPPNEYPSPVTAARPTRLTLAEQDLDPVRLLRVSTDGRIGTIRNRIAAGIASWFRTLLDSGPTFDPGTGKHPPRPLHPGDLMVLTYSHSESKLIAKALREAGLPSMFFKADGLFQSREALELKDLLGAVLRPDDPDARGRALLTRFFGFGLAEAEACLDLPAGHRVLARLERWRELADGRRYPRLFNSIMEDSGIVRRLLLTEAGDRALTNLRHITEHLLAEATASHPDLEDLVLRLGRWIREEDLPAETEEAGTQRAEGHAKAVRILTIHKAKGLDAPVVALFGGYGKRPPQPGEGVRFHDPEAHRCFFLGPQKAMARDLRQIAEREARQEDERKLYVAITRPKVQLVLPVFEVGERNPPDPAGVFDDQGDPEGSYGLLNRRLRALLESQPQWGTWAIPLPGPTRTRTPGQAPAWPERIPPPPKSAVPDFGTLARRGRPLWTYSFSSLSRAFGQSTRTPGLEEAGHADEVETPRTRRASGGLPGGTATGSALHKLLERIPPGGLAAVGEEAWRAEHHPLAEECLRREGLDPGFAGEALDLAFLALSTTIGLPDGTPVVLDAVTRRIPEMEFQMPFPGHPDALEGSIDLLFEWQGRVYLLDWKSNSLEDDDYGKAAVERAVAAHYDLQVRIYTLVALELAGIRDEAAFDARFGGAVYLFLRGLPAGGVWSHRPAWSDVLRWRQELSALGIEKLALNRMEWGMHG